MGDYYQVIITKTAKPRFSKQKYDSYDGEVKNFSSLAEAKLYIKTIYGNYKRIKMFMDGKTPNDAIHIGWIYSYTNYEFEDGKMVYYTYQDWIEIRHIVFERVV